MQILFFAVYKEPVQIRKDTVYKEQLKTLNNFRYIVKKCYIRTLKLSINQLNRYETNI